MKTLTILFGFVLIIVSVGFFFMTYFFYKKVNDYLMDNNKNVFQGQLMLTLQFGFRNLYLGMLHSILRPLGYYIAMLIIVTS